MGSNAVWEGIAALLGMQQPSLYGLMGCFQKKPVLRGPGHAGHGQHKWEGSTCPLPHAKSGRVLCEKAGGEHSVLLTPLSAAPPPLTLLHPSKSV